LLRLLADPRRAVRGRVVLACAPGERHELGLLMVALLLRGDGWAVDYLGAETPVADALAHAAASGAGALGISVTMPDLVAPLLRELRGADVPAGLSVLLGGAGASLDLARAPEVRYVRPGLRNAVTQLRRVAA
jgi:methanogenic corrinoid protein MtbC1